MTIKPGLEYRVLDQWLGKPRPIRVIVVGAGISGIAAVKIFKERFKDLPATLVLYEKNHDVGGTWLENRYPGCSCDIPAHGYTYSWEGNPNWSKAYVGSEEIFDYYKSRAKAYGVFDYVHLQHKVREARWNDDTGKWIVQIEDTVHSRVFKDEAEVLINAGGFLNNWKWPDIEGISDYKGFLVHSAKWDDAFSFEGKTVGVIGSGSSAIQIVPVLQKKAKELTSFIRSPTWITPEFGPQFAKNGRDTEFSEEEKALWASNPELFLQLRKAYESGANTYFDREIFEKYSKEMRQRLGNKSDVASVIIPSFAVGCRRMTPGHGYLEALAADNVTVKSDPIRRFTSSGIEMVDGKILEFDSIVCATGFDNSYRPSFPVIGFDGKDLREVWREEPRSYLSVSVNGFPNYFMASGPNFPLANGSLIPCLEQSLRYAFEAAAKIQSQGVKSLDPKPEAVAEFQEHKDAVMEELVWTSNCRSWYKNGKVDGKVWGPWCGSALHYMELLSTPRWEDYEIRYTSSNRFQYLGRGKSSIEGTGGDLAWYVTEPGA
ncbi:hypothetical protein F5884DRAFT_873328 [Xylogone sp. PMI_703]|nr:hypothetical protein F5884DRAFT_873328 [Xylogone sp. PMI_703]